MAQVYVYVDGSDLNDVEEYLLTKKAESGRKKRGQRGILSNIREYSSLARIFRFKILFVSSPSEALRQSLC
jgi:hypothetical protein